MPLYYSIGLLVLFFVLLVLEFFIPTAGMLGVAAAITAITSIVIGFTHSLYAGAAVTAIIAVATPIILVTMIRVWPNTFIGKMILNRRPGQEIEPVGRKTRDGQPLDSLEGKTGIARTDMLPAGRIEIEGHKMNAVSMGTPIDKGSQIIVVKTSGGRIRVRLATAEEITGGKEFDFNSSDEIKVQKNQADEKSDPKPGSALESLDLDSLE